MQMIAGLGKNTILSSIIKYLAYIDPRKTPNHKPKSNKLVLRFYKKTRTKLVMELELGIDNNNAV